MGRLCFQSGSEASPLLSHCSCKAQKHFSSSAAETEELGGFCSVFNLELRICGTQPGSMRVAVPETPVGISELLH